MNTNETKINNMNIFAPDYIHIGCKDTLDFNLYKYTFKFDTWNGGKVGICSNDDKIVNFIKGQEKNNYYELNKPNIPHREFYDIDYHIDQSDFDFDGHTLYLVDKLLDVRNELLDEQLSRKDIIIQTAHRADKLSIHWISKRTYFRNSSIHKFHSKLVKQQIPSVDIGIYDKNRCMRFLGQTKHGEVRPLKLFMPTRYSYGGVYDSLCTHFLDTNDSLEMNEVNRPLILSATMKEIRTYNEEEIEIRNNYRGEREYIAGGTDNQIVDTFIKSHPEYCVRVGGGYEYIRLDKISRSKCLTSNEFHSTQNACIFTEKGEYFFRCFCNPTRLKIGVDRDYSSYKEITTFKPEKIHHTTHCYDKYISYEEYEGHLENNELIFNGLSTGNGKTTNGMKYSADKKVLYVSYLIAIDDDISNNYDIHSYKRGRKQDWGTESLSICLNSLNKVKDSWMNYDVVFIDEIRSVLKQTEMPGIEDSTNTLLNILEFHPKVVCMDANMTDDDISFVLHMRSRSSDPKYVVLKNNPTPAEFEIIHHDNTIELIDHIIQQKQKFVCMYSIGVDRIKAIINSIPVEKKILHIHKETRHTFDFEKVDWELYDAVFVSPTWGAGINISHSSFNNWMGYGLFSGNSCTAEIASQMLRRFRHVKLYRVSLDCGSYTPLYTTREEYKIYVESNLKKVSAYLTKHRQLNPKTKSYDLRIIQDDFWDLNCKNRLELEKDKSNYLDTFYQKLVNNNFKIFQHSSFLSIEDEKAMKDELAQKKHDIKVERAKSIKECELLLDHEYEHCKNSVIDENLERRKDKYKIHKALNIGQTTRDIDFYFYWDNPKRRFQIHNLRSLFVFNNFKRINVLHLLKDNLYKTHSDGNTSYSMRRYINCKEVQLLEISKILNKLGLDYISSPKEIPLVEFDAKLSNRYEILSPTAHRKLCVLLGLSSSSIKYDARMESGDTFLRFLNEIIKVVGLKIDRNEDFKIVRQKCVLQNVQLYSPNKEYPSLLHGYIPEDKLSELTNQVGRIFQNIKKKKEFCVYCKKVVILNEKHLNCKTHLKNVECGEPPEFTHECDNCLMQYTTERKYLIHYYKCTGSDKKIENKCGCGKSFNSLYLLKNHISVCVHA